MTARTEWLVDAEGCSPDRLRDIAAVRRVCEEVISSLGLHVVGDPLWYQFPEPGGVTGLYLLAESHLACHTYPEVGVATFNLYCCRPRPCFFWDASIRKLLEAARVTVRSVERAADGTESSDELAITPTTEVANR